MGANLTSANLNGARLTGAHLTGARLGGANLGSADLSASDLTIAILAQANLVRSNLCNANLTAATLSAANLKEVNLDGANLTNADLTNAILHSANLSGANLTDVDLTGADLTGAILCKTILGRVSLANVIGLETCLHLGPSVVDIGTLRKSTRLPLLFLRGVGMPDQFIEYLPSLLRRAIQYYSCFISCSSKDQQFADRLHADLQSNGVRCWFAPHDMPIGGKILDEVHAAIRLRDKVLLILSEHSIGSDWVENEVTRAFAEERQRKHIILFPVRL
jgi:TIR domain/Pentapeptide repeats (8 copies)